LAKLPGRFVEEDVLLAREVAEEGAPAGSRLGDDVLDPRLLDPLGVDLLDRCLVEAVPDFDPSLLLRDRAQPDAADEGTFGNGRSDVCCCVGHGKLIRITIMASKWMAQIRALSLAPEFQIPVPSELRD